MTAIRRAIDLARAAPSMLEQPPPSTPKPKRKRTVRKRPRRIPNAAPGFEAHAVPAEPSTATPTARADPPASDAPAMFVPKGILAIEHLGDTDNLADDFTLFTPEQRKFWAGAKARHRRINADDKRKFVEELSRIPSVAGAAKRSGFAIRSWYCLRARDPAFAAQWDAAIKAGLPALEHAAMVRAFHGVERPIFQNGQRVGSELVMSDRLAEVLLRAHDPQRFSEKLMVAGQVNGTVHHVHHLSPALEGLAGKMLGLVADPAASSPALPAPVSAGVGSLLEQLKPQGVVENGTAQSTEDERSGKKLGRSSG